MCNTDYKAEVREVLIIKKAQTLINPLVPGSRKKMNFLILLKLCGYEVHLIVFSVFLFVLFFQALFF